MRIIAYTYEAAFYCVECAKKRASAGGFTINPSHPNNPPRGKDENGIAYASEDCEGNLVHPVFSTDEMDDSECCDDCLGRIGDEARNPEII